MAKLTRSQIKAHQAAEELLRSGRILDHEDVMDVLEGWHEGASHSNAAMSAFFTPFDLAMSMAMEVPTGRILDLCSGIGALSIAVATHHARNGSVELTLVEADPTYCEVARRLLPDARVICGSVFDEETMRQVGTGYDCVVSNPPFGNMTKGMGRGPRYSGSDMEYAVVDVASDLADRGVFILPQQAVPFRQSCAANVVGDPSLITAKYQRFVRDVGVELGPNMGIDCSFAIEQWRGTKVRVEIAVCDFAEARSLRGDGSSDANGDRTTAVAANADGPDLLDLMAA